MTTTQTHLDFAELVVPVHDQDASLAEQFAAFHAANPHVADALERLADEWLSAGNDRASSKALYERLRWESGIRTSGKPYALDNNWTAFYARLLVERRPEWSAAFTFREQKDAPD